MDDRDRRATEGHVVALATAYAANFAALAASSPFLALFLPSAGFSDAATAEVLAALLLVRVVATPAWTFLADRTASLVGVLAVVTVGAVVAFGALSLALPAPVVVLLLVAFAVFRAPFGALLDALVLRDVGDARGAFGAVRAWGTAGYAVGAMATGVVVARGGPRAIVWTTVALLAAGLVPTWQARRGPRPAPVAHAANAPSVLDLVKALARRPRYLALLGVALLHQLGLAPYDSLFPAYLSRIGGATMAGVAVAVGASAEFLFMLSSGALARRHGAERLLVAACAASAVRWLGIALVTNALALVALQVLHALSFGAFYVACVHLVDRETPPSLRASGQGLFGSFSYGVAASIALSIAGAIEPHGGMRAVFAVSSAASLLAMLVAWGLARSPGDDVDRARSSPHRGST